MVPVLDQLKDDNISIEEKLKIIDELLTNKELQAEFNRANGRAIDAPVDPAELTVCDGCE